MNRRSILLCLLLAVGRQAAASVVMVQTPEKLAHQASAVVRGTVLSQEPGVDAAAKVDVVRTRIRFTETWKGSTPTVIVVQQIGVLRDTVVRGIAGDARFSSGEDVILFLKEGQGKYSVHRAEIDALLVDRDLRAPTLVRFRDDRATEMLPSLPALKRLVVTPAEENAR